MKLGKLLKGLVLGKSRVPLKKEITEKEITGIAYDSRLVRKGFLFVAVRGFAFDGHKFIKEAISRGATAIITESSAGRTDGKKDIAGSDVSYLEVPDTREALALISDSYYDHPSGRLSLVGITGTNGKTTTSFITKNIIEAGGSRAGLLGSIRYMTGRETTVASNTTPESLDLQGYLDRMVKNEMKYAVIEVSSHALALKRVHGCSFSVAAFTNFTQDHLDFHVSMDRYFSEKSRLFGYLKPGGTAVLNSDDHRVRGLENKLDCGVITCGMEKGAMIRAENIREYRTEGKDSGTLNERSGSPYMLAFDIQTPENRFEVETQLIGRFNVYNILMSAGISYALGMKEDIIQKGIQDAKPVEGRFENVDEGQGFLCIVDYAHTEDALRNLLNEAKTLVKKKIITVFGCGGDRDRTKRPLMGAAASELSDMVIVTSDNPRSEDPQEIIKDILKGIKNKNFSVQPDREKAIREAVSLAEEGDILLVAGKGHEEYQEAGGVRHHFSDREVFRTEIKRVLAKDKHKRNS